jgi:hypothetical protein
MSIVSGFAFPVPTALGHHVADGRDRNLQPVQRDHVAAALGIDVGTA